MRFPPAEGGISGGADFVRLVSPLSAEASAFRGPESPISNKSLGFSIGFPFKGVYEATTWLVRFFFTGSLGCFKVCLTWQAWDF